MNMALALAVALAAPSCVGKDDEELFTQVEVTVCPPEGVVMERFQATMVFENVTRHPILRRGCWIYACCAASTV